MNVHSEPGVVNISQDGTTLTALLASSGLMNPHRRELTRVKLNTK